MLVRHFVQKHAKRCKVKPRPVSREALARLVNYDWPGNVRELENRLKRAVVMADRRLIDAADLELAAPTDDPPDLDIRSARLRAERDVIQEALVRSNNTLSVAARLLGVSRPTLYALMEAHGFANETARSADAPPANIVVAEPTLQND
jgi:two-component system NtrC family response regulator